MGPATQARFVAHKLEGARVMSSSRWRAGVIAVAAGMGVNFLGDWLLGVRIDIFRGMATFTPAWMVDVFLVNFFVGLVVARFFGRHAKWLAIVPPLIVRCLSYGYLYFVENHSGDFFLQLQLHYWGPTVILAVECANAGGILGEVLMRVYHRKGNPEAKRVAGAVPASQPAPVNIANETLPVDARQAG